VEAFDHLVLGIILMKVTVIGTGYVGLVSGVCLAEVGNTVLCIDSDASKIDMLQAGRIPIYEPGLVSMVQSNTAAGQLKFSTSIEDGVKHGEIILIAVGTPPDEDGSADLSHVLSVARDIGEFIEDYRIIVTKSTVPVGTAEKVRDCIEQSLANRDALVEFSVVSNPEFLKEGAAIEDFMKPDRIVIGADDSRAVNYMRALYAPFNRNRDRIIVMDVPSAELTKYAANALLATKISFMNEMANLAERLGADIEAVRKGIGSDPRIGYHFIYPGCGYGGSCFPKDVRALSRTARRIGYETQLLDAVESVNYQQKSVLLEKIRHYFNNDLKGKHFAIWGLAFKPNTDDMREAPSRMVIEGLWREGASIQAFDPVAEDEARRIYGNRTDLVLASDPYEAVRDADGLVVVTEWNIFRSPNLDEIGKRMKGRVIFDGRNIYDPTKVREKGFDYVGIGR
jgi:UDPglucose 6-dehydrogenase